MPSPDRFRPFALLLLAALAFVCALGAIREARRRSTIPLELDGVLERKAIGFEKHPGLDDLCYLDLRERNGRLRRIQVDAALWQRLAEGDRLEKRAGEATLRASDRTLPLSESEESRAIGRALLAILASVSIGWAFVFRRERTAGR